MRNLLLLLFCLFPALSHPQIERYTPKVRFAFETYAFLKGQSSALQMIAFQFPHLQSEVEEAARKSKVLFRQAERNIEDFLEDELKNPELNILKMHIDSLQNEQLKKPIEKEKHARDFLNKVKERPHLITDSLVLHGILSFAYHDMPHQEIADGYFKNFTTKGHVKAKETALKLSIPKSWLAEEAKIPQTVQQFTSYYGNGHEKFLIVIHDLPAEQKDFTLDEKSVPAMIPAQSKLIRTSKTTIDGRSGMMIEVEEIVNYNAKMKIRMLQFMFIHKRKLYCLQGSIGPVEASKNLEQQIKKYEPLFRLIVEKTKIEN